MRAGWRQPAWRRHRLWRRSGGEIHAEMAAALETALQKA